MSFKTLSRIGIVVATFAAASAIASPSAWAAPTVTVTPAAGTFTVGDKISAAGNVGSGVDTPATFVMKVYKNGNCSGTPLGVGAVKNINSTSGGGPYTFAIGDGVDPVKGADAGTYSWSGTLDQESGADIVVCSTPTVVSAHSPNLTVQATNASLGSAVKATATLSNRTKTPVGGPATSMVFGLYPPADGTCTGAPLYSKSMQVYTDENSYDSGNFSPSSAGKYRWKITYTGDGNNAAVTAGCGVTTSTVTSDGTPPPPPAAVPTCEGAPATIVGSSKGETIIGTNGNDVIVARGGNDVVNGKGGNDLICGGSGKDILRGGGGNDVLHGGDGSDDVQGNAGNDQLYGERGGDRIVGGGGNDKLYGGPGNDGLDGGKGTDYASGGPGTDVARSIEKT